ncbi:unnamed protein product [Mytilus coruscus]|uniref:B box-type domain-containing protein n=1 Tax=Mytilus coruscus TaxID=42192 RepID=A0A6J8A6V7_MYTCO|nr:unnamed protein product [Mytilus coruscus]
MASNSYCETCSGEGKSIAAVRFCSDCDEALCKECVEYHQKCKATKSHYLMDLAAILEVNNWKSHLIKQIDTFEKKITVDLSNCKTKNLDQLWRQNAEISELYDSVQGREQELKFLKEHGSNNQLYFKLREYRKGVQGVVKRVQEMAMSYKKVHLKFEKRADIDLKSMGSIIEVEEPGVVQYSPVKLQQAQVQQKRVESLLTLKKEITKQLKLTDKPDITDIAVTTDNTLFLCNYILGMCQIYVYKTKSDGLTMLTYNTTLRLPCVPYGICIVTGTDKAVVTLPRQSYAQFINTKRFTLDKIIPVGNDCYGITTSGEYIAVGTKGEIRILKHNGENVRNIVLRYTSKFDSVRSLYYDHNDGSMIYRTTGQITSIQLDGPVLYRYTVSGITGIAVDTRGHVYVSERNRGEIQRLLPDGRFCDVVLTEKDGIKDAFAIAFDESFTTFYVTNNNGLVQIYNCK